MPAPEKAFIDQKFAQMLQILPTVLFIKLENQISLFRQRHGYRIVPLKKVRKQKALVLTLFVVLNLDKVV